MFPNFFGLRRNRSGQELCKYVAISDPCLFLSLLHQVSWNVTTGLRRIVQITTPLLRRRPFRHHSRISSSSRLVSRALPSRDNARAENCSRRRPPPLPRQGSAIILMQLREHGPGSCPASSEIPYHASFLWELDSYHSDNHWPERSYRDNGPVVKPSSDALNEPKTAE